MGLRVQTRPPLFERKYGAMTMRTDWPRMRFALADFSQWTERRDPRMNNVIYEQTLRAINEYYHSNGTRGAVVEAFRREHPVSVEGLDYMTPSYIAWLIDRRYPVTRKLAKEIQFARSQSKDW